MPDWFCCVVDRRFACTVRSDRDAALARRVRLWAKFSWSVRSSGKLQFYGGLDFTAGFSFIAATLVLGEYMMAVPEPTWQARILATGWIALCGWFSHDQFAEPAPGSTMA
jgi:hypothetical protein